MEFFEQRHNAPNQQQIEDMLEVIGVETLTQLIDETIPASIRLQKKLDLPQPLSEQTHLKIFEAMASKNKVFKSYIGMGYYDVFTPPVILRNILENPNWYTPYTPYQAEISQGRLEALMNFQTMVANLSGMDVSNASLLDEASAAAEAMQLLYAHQTKKRKNAHTFFVDANAFPQTIAMLKTRSHPLGIKLIIEHIENIDLTDDALFGIYLQQISLQGEIHDFSDIISQAKKYGLLIAMGSDLMSLALLKPPGEIGADVAIGSSQRFGVPMGFGGPHAAFFATKDIYKRLMPGRIIGASIDKERNLAYRMSLQTREQHIRREKATSNICTAQVLLAIMAGMYAVYHGPKGLKNIALRIHHLAKKLEEQLECLGVAQLNHHYFDTLLLRTPHLTSIQKEATKQCVNFRYEGDQYIGISLDETSTLEDVEQIVSIFEKAVPENNKKVSLTNPLTPWPNAIVRQSNYLEHEIFNNCHTEHQMLRYIKRLESKDISMTDSMISLGSCTMKLNATTEMLPVTWSAWNRIHPFAPTKQTEGYKTMIASLSKWLMEITQYAGISLQPNSGAQGEYTGLLTIRAYHKNKGEEHRKITLIPDSAHGTNPASAIMAGLTVVGIKSDDKGRIDINDLTEKAQQHSQNLSCLMVTYPSTYGVFEENILEICNVIHKHGGMVYMDGANMNAQVGLTSPQNIGADVCHLNLHKTFCIPHGGGGPGMGPICVNEKLKPYLPSHPLAPETGGNHAIGSVAAAPWGSASILSIPYSYIAMMGGEGLTRATMIAILNANYIKTRLSTHYDILYTGEKSRCAHEMVIDCRPFKKINIEVEDIAKRLIDYGFHPPTVSFPVAGTMMIEPTESEPKEELDRFCDALIAIRSEIKEIEQGQADELDNVLKNAPHTVSMLTKDIWDKPYSRHKAAYPLPYLRKRKFWAPVARVDNAYGDRSLTCLCPPVEAYDENLAKTTQGDMLK